MEKLVGSTMQNSLISIKNKTDSKVNIIDNIDEKDYKIPEDVLDGMRDFNRARHGDVENEKTNYIIEGLPYEDVKAFNNSFYMKNSLKQKSLLKWLGPESDVKEIANLPYNQLGDKNVFITKSINNVSTSDSLAEFFSYINESLIVGKTDYLDLLQTIFAKYMDFVNGIRNILSRLGDYTKAGDKDGYINIDLTQMIKDLEEFRSYTSNHSPFEEEIIFSPDSEGHYHRTIDYHKIFYENIESVNGSMNTLNDLLNGINGIEMARSLDIDPNSNSHFKFFTNIKLDDLDKLIASLKAKPSGAHDILQTEFDLLKKSFDALEKKINTNLDELSKKTSAANSNYDNFVKIVSGSINTLLEMAKGFLRF